MAPVTYELPYYATGLRHHQLATALQELTPSLLRHGALEVRVYRSKEDAYRFRQLIVVAGKADWTRLWNHEEFVAFRTRYIGWYQKPLAYAPHDLISHGTAGGVVDPLGEDPYAPAATGPANAGAGAEVDTDLPGHGGADVASPVVRSGSPGLSA